MGMSRDTFYRYKNAIEEGGVEVLIEKNRRKPNLKNRVDEHTEVAVTEYAIPFPAHGQVRANNIIEFARFISLQIAGYYTISLNFW